MSACVAFGGKKKTLKGKVKGQKSPLEDKSLHKA